MKKAEMHVLGTIEEIDFPDVGLFGVKAKVDTGATTSSIDARQIKIVKKQFGYALTCRLINKNQPVSEFTDFSTREVKSSNGATETRYVVKLPVLIYGKKIKTEFTLANRNSMAYPVLLGKRLLKGRFLVDVSKKNMSLAYKKTDI